MAAKRANQSDRSKASRSDGGAVLVTGASGLLGGALVRRLLASGRSVIALCHSTRSAKLCLEKTPEAASSGQLRTVVIDLMKPDALGKSRKALLPHAAQIGGFVHCARSRDNLAVDGLADEKQWADEFRLGVSIPFDLAQLLAAAPGTGLKRVVLVGSMYGIVAVNPNLYPTGMKKAPAHYGVVRGAIPQATRELAASLIAKGINVNAVTVGGIEGRVSPAFKRRYAKFCPQGRMLSVEEAVQPIEFLLSAAASGIVGHNLVVDGGWSIW